MVRALVCPGQGAQSIGMGKLLADEYPSAKAVFEEVDEALSENLSSLIWKGDIEEMTLTQNAQPALMAMSLAALRGLESEGFKTENCAYFAGHSLGEYSALAMAKAISVSDAARLLRARGLAMQDAVPVGIGAMAAILGLNFTTVQSLAVDAQAAGIYAESFSQDPEFYEFTRSMKAYVETFESKSDVMLIDSESEFFKYLNDKKDEN